MATLLEKLQLRYKAQSNQERAVPDGYGGTARITPVTPLQIQQQLNLLKEMQEIETKDTGQQTDNLADERRSRDKKGNKGKKNGHRNGHR
jgi:hypothetical protein